MGYALCNQATGKILGWWRYDTPPHDPATQVVVESAEPPDPVTQRWDGATGLRAATQGELDQDATDAIANLREEAKALYDRLDALSRAIRGVVKLAVDEINLLRQRDRDRSADVAAASNLTDLKNRWAARAALNDRTYDQARTALLALIDGE